MAVTHLAPGKIDPVIYFQNLEGVIRTLPTRELSYKYRNMMRKMGYEMMFAETLAEARKFVKRMNDQIYKEQQAELYRDEAVTSGRRNAIKARLTARRNSPACSTYERDFIDLWLKERELKHSDFMKRFTQQRGSLDFLEYDNPEEHLQSLLDRT